MTDPDYADALTHAGLHDNADAFVRLYGEAPDTMTWAVCMRWYKAGVWERERGSSCAVENCSMVPKVEPDEPPRSR